MTEIGQRVLELCERKKSVDQSVEYMQIGAFAALVANLSAVPVYGKTDVPPRKLYVVAHR